MTEIYWGSSVPAGSHHVDIAQPLANVAFYCLEAEVGDGLVGGNCFNNYLGSRWAPGSSVAFPVFKYLNMMETPIT